MVAQFAQRAEGVLAHGADAHGPVRLHHHGRAARLPRAVDHVGHEVQGGLEQQTVVAGKQFLVHQLLDLRDTGAETLGDIPTSRTLKTLPTSQKALNTGLNMLIAAVVPNHLVTAARPQFSVMDQEGGSGLLPES